jgi:hypothetical protein
MLLVPFLYPHMHAKRLVLIFLVWTVDAYYIVVLFYLNGDDH